MAKTERFAHHMSDEDALMWNIEKDPILRSTILAVAIFDRIPDWNVLRRRMERTSRLIPRFRQRVLSPPLRMGPPRWTVEPTFDLDFHLRRTRLSGAGTARAPPHLPSVIRSGVRQSSCARHARSGERSLLQRHRCRR